jgi:hypothetical protein
MVGEHLAMVGKDLDMIGKALKYNKIFKFFITNKEIGKKKKKEYKHIYKNI